ncbi:integrase [Roseovarius sp. MBR-51]
MVMMMKLKYVDELPGGRKRFRKRWPHAVFQVLGEKYFQVPMKAREGAALVAEQESLLAEYEKIVAKAKRKAAGRGQLSPLEHWREATAEAKAMVAAIKGSLEEDERREILADDLHQRGADPILVKAVMQPEAEEPPVTMLDAKKMYFAERVEGEKGRYKRDQLERVCSRVEKALGPLSKLPLVDLKQEHKRKLRDSLLAETKADGSPLSTSSLEREHKTLVAMVSLAITEFDLEGKASNPFKGMDLTRRDAPPVPDGSVRESLPDDVIRAMRARVRDNAKEPALALIWRLLEGTGCRVAEVVGLRVEDVDIDHTYPHLRIRWHEGRRVKTKVSIRDVPLVGDALEAAKEALKLAERETMLFPKYDHTGGPEAVSQALMKHLRVITKDKRHVLHSLRHNMKDWFLLAKVPERDEHRILGHSQGGIGDSVYGGSEARLKATHESMERAMEEAP